MKKLVLIIAIILLISLLKVHVSAQDTATPEGDAIREAVQEKIEEAQNKPKAYLGTITDIVENTVQIKNLEEEIKQISVRDNTVFVKINNVKQTLKFSDIAIGDFLVNMGYIDANSVLAAKRILVTSEPAKPERVSVFGIVTSIGKNEITVKRVGSEDQISISPETGAVVSSESEKGILKSRFSEISEGSTILAVGSKSEDTLSARTIHVTNLPSPQNSPDTSSE